MTIPFRLVLVALLLAAPAGAQLPVVPGAPLTVGMRTRAAYGCSPTNPVVLRVTNLNDSGAGSFRAAVTDSRPRVVVFETSGTIAINTVISINAPCITVAGQTAPSPGITIRSNTGTSLTEAALYIGARDVLLQHLRIRMGNLGCNSNFQIYGGNQHNIVLDHLSISWGQDDNVALNWTNAGNSTDLTLYRSIVSEGIEQGAQGAACTGGGATNGHAIFVGPSSQSSAYVQNVLATNVERNPYMRADTRTVIMNNVIYQWHGPWGFFYNNGSVSFAGSGNDPGGGPWYSTVVGNRSIAGPMTCCTGGGDDSVAYQFFYSINNIAVIQGNQIYRRDNTLAPPPSHVKIVEEQNQYPYNPNVSAPPSQAPLPAGYTPLASTALEGTLFPIVGARPTDRDAVDTRTIKNVVDRAGTWVHDVADVGGYPNLAVNKRTFTEPANPHGQAASGYTNLEESLHGMAASLEGGSAPEPPTPGPPDVPAAAGMVFVQDTFTGPAATPLTQHQPEVGGGYTQQQSAIAGLQIGDNDLFSTGVGNGTLTLAHAAPLSDEYDVAGDFVLKSVIAGHEYGLWARANVSDPLTGIAFLYNSDNKGWQLNEFSSSGLTTLGSCPATPLPAGQTAAHVVLRVRKGSVHGVVDGKQCTSSDAATVTAAGLVGLSTYFPGTVPDSASTGIHFDNLTATDMTTGPGIQTVTVILLLLVALLSLLVVILVALLIRQSGSPGAVRMRPV